jgi:hypothetical protein
MPDEYEKALTHVAYEYVALVSAFKVVSNPPTTAIFVTAFDSFLLHYRTLVEFFSDPKKIDRKDDIRAIHYVPTWNAPALPMWDVWKNELHTLLAHLSTKRNPVHEQKTGLDHTKHFKPMRNEIQAAWSAFAQGLTGTIHAGKLPALVKHHQQQFAIKR